MIEFILLFGFGALVLCYFAIFLSLGLRALVHACWGRFVKAQYLGWLCLLMGGTFGVWLAIVSLFLGFPLPWIFAVPAILGGMALLHSYSFRDVPAPGQFQFPILAVFYATFLTAIVTLAGVQFHRLLRTDDAIRREFAANLSRMDQIENVNVMGSVYRREFHVQQIEFSLAGRPDTLVRINPDDKLRTCDADEPLPEVMLIQVDRWLVGGETQPNANTRLSFIGIDVHQGGRFEKSFPFPLQSIDDIAAHYDELVELLDTWPREEKPGRMETADGLTIEYWKVDGGAPTKGP
ncbi:hypothetical protein LOC68_15740 [Blastopirellula sp. JC732]|uniref:Uncharacterized protein n=1 Tax=Blastopirellula sediminis TaxID=2894196 RepID=A0A9X1MPW3_9BACT|nr:hypothetical protein [Blastopirellula sediminis]MCC9606862.1 hypothetical protein [Blastopirellula sediminis]MCC9629842.1 hypothetical protein [Blastopirellula sediminis]